MKNNKCTFKTELDFILSKSASRKTSTLNLMNFPLVSLLFIISANSSATSLSQAVNAELEVPAGTSNTNTCGLLLSAGGTPDPNSGLATICSRAAPLGSVESGSNATADNSTVMQDYTLLLMEQANKKNNKKKITESNMSGLMLRNEQVANKNYNTSLSAQWTFFASFVGSRLNHDVTTEEDGYNSRLVNLLVGSTYVINKANTLGAAVTYRHHNGDYLNGGDFKDTASGARLMETYHPTDKLFIQAVAGLDSFASKRTRSASFTPLYDNGTTVTPGVPYTGTPYSDNNYHQTEFSLLSGYTLNSGSFTFTPQLGLNWLTVDYGTYSESGNSGLELRFYNDKRKSLQSTLGLQVTDAISTRFGVILPQVNLAWKHEFSDKSRKVNVSFVYDASNTVFSYDTPAADKDFFELGAGAAFVFARGIQSYVRIQTIAGKQYYNSTTATLGLNIEL